MGEYNDMKKWTYLPIIGIVIGELLILSNNILAGIGLHIINLLAIILIIIFGNLSLNVKNVLQSLTLLPLLRIISLSIPQFDGNFDGNVRYLIMYGIMLVPIYMIMKNQYILHKEYGTNLSILLYSSPSFKRVYIYMPTVILLMFIMIMIGQYVGVIPNIQTIQPEVIGEFVSIFLIIILSISLLVSDTKYWNEYISRGISIYSSPLLLIFVTIVINKIMFII